MNGFPLFCLVEQHPCPLRGWKGMSSLPVYLNSESGKLDSQVPELCKRQFEVADVPPTTTQPPSNNVHSEPSAP